ncbi:hypothetical protein CGP82_04450 [Campylobacter sp. LR185c]|nr:hypothetical protein CGP82_04450 [Campylobacter sp. LR185c]
MLNSKSIIILKNDFLLYKELLKKYKNINIIILEQTNNFNFKKFYSIIFIKYSKLCAFDEKQDEICKG